MKRGFAQQFSLQTLFSESLPQFSRTLVNDNQPKSSLRNVQLICTRPQSVHDAHFWNNKPIFSLRNDKSLDTNSSTETKLHNANELNNNGESNNMDSSSTNTTALAMFNFWKFADAAAMLYCWNFLQQLAQSNYTHMIHSQNDQLTRDTQNNSQLWTEFAQYLYHKSTENNAVTQQSHHRVTLPSNWLQLSNDPFVSQPTVNNLDTASHAPSTKVFLVLSSQYFDRYHSDIKWQVIHTIILLTQFRSRLLITEIVHKAILAAENIYCSTLGAAYAAMFRDSLNLANAEKAKEFAERQLSVGKRLGDRSLKRKARIYIGYYHIFRKEYQQAKTLLEQQLISATLEDDEEVRKMADAAIVRCERDFEWENYLMMQTQKQLVIEAAPGAEDENDLMQAD